ncbi:winged helix-turn-helix domain-containing protein [Vulcanisaeta sp. JCM 14467]|uniref:winged helix-turn-helix domain-containing protein n=1 Tax=Vulcanisaeta sp. JCM 14467 TaxID=1295370 RepID=UPI0006D14EA3|nr:winged helix-turn-helix domain-containing protein [Vulcanisaeta sp. JCM 14467]
MSVSVRFRVWVEVNGRHVIGPGGYEILKAINEVGSISGAARKLGMSYRFVWNYIERMEKTLGMKLVDARKGGKGRGGAKLTPEGQALLRYYEEIIEEMSRVADKWSHELSLRFQGLMSGGNNP